MCATTGATGSEIDTTIEFEAVGVEINFYGLGFIQKVRVDNKFKTIDVKRRVRIGKLIQSHGQSGTSSAAFVEENPDGFDLFSFKILVDLVNCRLSNFEHNTLLGKKIKNLKLSEASGILSIQSANLTMPVEFVNPNCSECRRQK